MKTSLTIAVPSTGCLRDKALAFFSRAGLEIVHSKHSKDHQGTIQGIPDAEVIFLPTSDIVGQLATGTVHLGIAGEDLLREQLADADAALAFLSPLGFGEAEIVVSVPKSWIDVHTMADINDVAYDILQRHGRRLRVATQYVNLTRRFFAYHGISDYRIIESSGVLKDAAAFGSSEIIVDILPSGDTLTSNTLKTIDDGVILYAQANLVASLAAQWTQTAQHAAQIILNRVSAAEEARRTRELTAMLPAGKKINEEITARFQASMPFGPPDNQNRVVLHCPSTQVFALADFLTSWGAEAVVVRSLDWIVRPHSTLTDRLLTRIRADDAI